LDGEREREREKGWFIDFTCIDCVIHVHRGITCDFSFFLLSFTERTVISDDREALLAEARLHHAFMEHSLNRPNTNEFGFHFHFGLRGYMRIERGGLRIIKKMLSLGREIS
jgi:hypothetical protein